METSTEQFEKWLIGREDEHLEFKRAATQFSFDDLVKYCVALANERGGKLVLGVTDKRPRQVLGTQAFPEPDKLKMTLFDKFRYSVTIEELSYQNKRVLIFHIPSRPIGIALNENGTFWMRRGESLVGMDSEQIRQIHAETGPDYSAEICEKAVFSDLELEGIERFRSAWIRESKNVALAALSPEQLLSDAELVIDGGVTYAALILLGVFRLIWLILVYAANRSGMDGVSAGSAFQYP
jgi:ATP-dependent DNA helicase RecG